MSRPRDTAIDAAIVRACVELLGEVGRSGLTRAKVAERAGVSLPAVNRRYANVEEVLVAVARQPGSSVGADDRPEATSLHDYLLRTLLNQSRAFRDPAVRRAASELAAAAAGSPDVDHAFQETLQAQRVEGRRWVAQAQQEGSIRPDTDPDLLLDTVIGASYYRLLWRGLPITEDEAHQIVDHALRGVGR